MIISELAKKDTYVTNLHLGTTDATLSNVGKASTLDLFKISKENEKIKARALLTITDLSVDLVDNKSFVLKDTNNSITFVINRNVTYDDGRVDASGKVIIGIDSTSPGVNQLQKIINAINNVNVMDQTINGGSNQLASTLTLNITASKLDDKRILLEQDIEGEAGETTNTFDSNANFSLTDFKRIQHSALLLNFDLASLKTKHVTDLNNSVFSNSSNYKVYLKLFDVGEASTRPKDYNIKLSILNNNVDFEEGIGSDIYNFSDKGFTNFQKINDTTNWTNASSISQDDCVSSYYLFQGQNESIVRGNEDITFDITSYFNNYINNNIQSSNFIISFDLDSLYDDYTYFVKRFGSVQINNKIKHPRIELHIDENKVQNIESQNKKRYFDNEEIFYLYNKLTKLENFNENYNVKVRLEYKNTAGTNLLDDGANGHIITGFNFRDYKGTLKEGVKKFTIPSILISRFNSSIQTEIASKDSLKINFNYYYDNGASTIDIKSETITFYKSEVTSSIDNLRLLKPCINMLNNTLDADESIVKLVVDFIDLKREYKSVNIPIDLTSENLGKVFYSVFDIDTGEILVKKDEASVNANEMLYDGSSYIMNFFTSKIYKNRRVNFKFYYNDEVSLLENVLYDKSFSIRF
tara:strand:+ start:401 stop:2314 length:1914 start_codon:yes stop_codon:yes gene_type:complete